MAKHDFESDTLTTHDIMHCTLVYKVPGPDTTIVSIANYFGFRDYEVPTRPTGAHRQSDNVWADANVVILVEDSIHGTSFECPREFVYDDIAHMPVAVGFDYITVPRV